MGRRPASRRSLFSAVLAVSLSALAVSCGGGSSRSNSDAAQLPPPGSGGSTGAGGADAGAADASSDALGPMCGNGIVETGEACDGFLGCNPGESCSDTCTCVAANLPPQTRGLIAAALADGRIDYPTSLLLRAQALVGDERLPPEYDGDFSLVEDSALFLEINNAWAGLTADQQAALHPYIVRPTDPDSVYSQAVPVPAGAPPAMPPPVVCPTNTDTGLADWRSTETDNFVIWSCGGGDPTADPYSGQRDVAAAMAEEVWGLETPGLGAPRADNYPIGPAPTSRIDVYLLRTNECRMRGSQCYPVPSNALAAAAADSPCDGTLGPITSSGYMLLRLERIPASGSPGKARADFAHEFFHLISFGRNLAGQGGACRGNKTVGSQAHGSWLTESSAVWAEWAYEPDDDPDYRTSMFTGFQYRDGASTSMLTVTIQGTDSDGNETVTDPSYQAYAYPLFLAEDSGGKPDGFESFWTGNGGAHNVIALDDALDQKYPFDTHLRDFAVRLINKALPGDPIAPLLNTLDSAVAGIEPYYFPTKALFAESTMTAELPFHTTLMPLAMQYQAFNVPPSVRWVDIDLSKATHADQIALDVVALANGRWTRREPAAPRFTFCRDDMDDDISTFVAVISNFAHKIDQKVDDDYKIRTATVCPSIVSGSIRSVQTKTLHDSAPGSTTDQSERKVDSWTLSFPADGASPGGKASWTGNYDRHDIAVMPVSGPCYPGGTAVLQTIDATGGGGGTTPMILVAEQPGSYGLFVSDPTMLGSYDTTMTTYDEDCAGNAQSSTSMSTTTDPFSQVSSFVMLTPAPGASDPNHFVGSATIVHQDTPTDSGGEMLIDWTVTWDVRLSRH